MDTTQKKVTEYQVVDHGVENSQYFQGCGVAFTEYEECATGCGDDFSEALSDALESMAQNGAQVSREQEAQMLVDASPSDGVPEDAEDAYYYVSIRYNVSGDGVGDSANAK